MKEKKKKKKKILLNEGEETEQRLLFQTVIFLNPELIRAARLDYAWVRLNNKKWLVKSMLRRKVMT